MRTALFGILILLGAAVTRSSQTLDVYFIDVEGGQATLLVSPSGESLLFDAGWPGFGGRDADRIAAIAKLAGLSQIDYLVVTHYHLDHVGGVAPLAERLPIRTFVDHGPSIEREKQAEELFATYQRVREKATHIVARTGDRIPIGGIDVQVLSSAGEEISAPLPGAGAPNPLCAAAQPRETDLSENAQSIGVLITFGKFRMLNLADLTWNKELELVCPTNKVGTVDVYLSTHHAMNLSGPVAIVHALRPRVAIINNGAAKGGSVEAWQVIRSSPGLEDIWQLHYTVAAGKKNNAPKPFIANLREAPRANWIKLSADSSGQFTVTNRRNGKRKTYKPPTL